MSESRPSTPLSQFQMRLMVLGLLTSLWVLAVGGKLFYLTVSMRDTLQERAELQQQHTLKLDPRRGTIRDRNGHELATSVEVESVYAVPKAFSGARLEEAATALATCLSLPRDKIASRLTGDKSFSWLERKANPRTVGCVRDLSLASVGFLAETRRFYPKRDDARTCSGACRIALHRALQYEDDVDVPSPAFRRDCWARDRAFATGYGLLTRREQYEADMRVRRLAI